MSYICPGCQPKRDALGKHKSSSSHHCRGNGCMCGSCHSQGPVIYNKTWMDALGKFYIENTKMLVETLKRKPEEDEKHG